MFKANARIARTLVGENNGSMKYTLIRQLATELLVATFYCFSTGAAIGATNQTQPAFNLEQALSDRAQSTTLAFAGFGMMTGNLGAQTFFPPGKVADYWGFQYLRDNDPDNMGHNTSFLTRVSSNILFILNDSQITILKNLARNQVQNINLYAWKRYPLMKAFRSLMDLSPPTGATGLNLETIKARSKELYLLDGQLSFERAVVFAGIYRSLDSNQKNYLDAMVGKGYGSWPDKTEADVRSKTQGLSNDEVVAMMTYAGDLYSWYAGSITADVYFCPERHGTYFGSFFIKDAPAVGHPGYSIDETMTATVGSALVNSSLGYVSAAGATKMNALVATQKQNLYANTSANIVLARTKISTALRSLISATEPTVMAQSQVKSIVDFYSGVYGELDGENNYNYATTFYQIYNNIGGVYLTNTQKASLTTLRKKYMTVTYADGTTVDYSAAGKSYLYAAEVLETSSNYLSYTSAGTIAPLFTYSGNVANPQSGWWWNPAEPGRGYFIETTNGRHFTGSFLYDSGGNPIWYVTGPGSTGADNLNGTLDAYRGGQTLTGSYKSPTGPTASGNFSITFQSPTQGTISWPGGSVPINRYEIASGSLSAPTPSFKPETGWWWNANEGGRGFSIEIQGDNIFVAGFMYDGAGNPIWYVSGGKMTNANYYEGTWQQCAGGMAMSGPFRPTACSNLTGGSIAINFSSTTNATIRLPDGRQLTLTRFSF